MAESAAVAQTDAEAIHLNNPTVFSSREGDTRPTLIWDGRRDSHILGDSPSTAAVLKGRIWLGSIDVALNKEFLNTMEAQRLLSVVKLALLSDPTCKLSVTSVGVWGGFVGWGITWHAGHSVHPRSLGRTG